MTHVTSLVRFGPNYFFSYSIINGKSKQYYHRFSYCLPLFLYRQAVVLADFKHIKKIQSLSQSDGKALLTLAIEGAKHDLSINVATLPMAENMIDLIDGYCRLETGTDESVIYRPNKDANTRNSLPEIPTERENTSFRYSMGSDIYCEVNFRITAMAFSINLKHYPLPPKPFRQASHT
ncbi:protein-tyrosine kinase 2-beta-like [Thalassophryne amazonica]|uniref:protein-tyrosine kinase 2-beta-like n=1 Tax=Thalassophryne amazonica TaxID=390379 RepID=UPI001470E4C0|nr:protein-tyrosine kinase 2-beta-like [Thalassophryne amazonica]